MKKLPVSAVLFVMHCDRVANFYIDVFGVRASRRDADHAVLNFAGFDLKIHQIPKELTAGISVDSPPARRERASLRLNLPVADLAVARSEANRLGGQIDDLPPAWADGDTSLYLGHDPEGNVFAVTRADANTAHE
jgi:predicted enzyme related to lactoylglutathione lyase